jgi:flagellin
MASYNDTLSQLMMIKESVNSAKTSLNEMKSIAAQGASDSWSADVGRSLFERIDELRSDVNAIAATTSFNGQRLLDGSKARKTITTTQTVRNVASSATPAAQNFVNTSKAATTFTSIQGQRIEAAESLRVASGTGDSDEDILEATSLTAANSSSTSSQGTVVSAAGNVAVSITGSTVAPVVPVAGYSTLAGVSSMRAGDTITGIVRDNLTSQVTNFSFTAPQGQSITSQASIVSQFNASTAANAGVTASVNGSALRFTANAATSQIESVTASISRPTVTGTATTADDPVAAQTAAAGYSSLTAIDAQASNLLLNVGGTIKFQVDGGPQRTFTATQNYGAGGGSTTSKLNSLVSAFNAQATGSAWGVTMTLTASGNRDQLRITANASSSDVTSATTLTAPAGGVTTTGTQTTKVAPISAQPGSTTISGLSSLAAADSLSVEVLDRAATGTGPNRPTVLQTITLTGTSRSDLSAIANALQTASGGSLTASVNAGNLVLTATTLANDIRLGTVNIGATSYAGVDTPAIAEIKGASQLSDGTNSLTELQRGGTIAVTIGGSTTTYTANTTLDQASIIAALTS